MNYLSIMRSFDRKVYVSAFGLLGLIAFGGMLKDLFAFSLNSGVYTYIPMIPCVSLYLIHSERASIFSIREYSPFGGISLIAVSIVVYWFGKVNAAHFTQQDYLAVMGLAAVVFVLGGFILIYGGPAFRSASFPLLFLLLMVPLPSLLLSKLIQLLQAGSAGAADGILAITGVPYAREGFTFSLPGLSVEVAEQCSGIRSSLALLITSLLAGHLFLKNFRSKAILVLAVFPIAVFKNGVRIVTLAVLGNYWDKSILDGDLHRKGGIPFFGLALVMMGLLLWGLRKLERRQGKTGGVRGGAGCGEVVSGQSSVG